MGAAGFPILFSSFSINYQINYAVKAKILSK